MRRTVTFVIAFVFAMLGLSVSAQAPQTGVYRIQNVATKTYIKVVDKYDAQLVASQSDANYINVGIEKKLSDGTYKVNSLSSTYGANNTPVEVYDYITKALKLGEVELRKVLANSSESNVQRAINTMHQLAEEYGFMRMMPVDGQADTYHAIAVLPNIPDSVVTEWRKKVPVSEYGGTMWEWCKDLVIHYLDTHGTDAGLAARIRNNLAYIYEGHTYMLTTDPDGSFGYIDTENETSQFTSTNNRSWWKLTPKVNTDNVKDGTYKIHNIGTDKWVSIKSKYYAKPDAENEDAASDIRITFDGEANGGQKIVNLGGSYKDENGNDVAIDIYSYIEKAIFIGKTAIYNVLTQGNGVNPASPENIAVAQEFMETFVKDNAFMCMKPVPGKDDAVYAYATIPHIPERVITEMFNHHAITAETEAAAWAFGVQKVKDYLGEHAGTDNTLRAYILANIDNIQPGTTYYLSAHPSDGTFDYAAEGEFDLTDTHFQWGFEVEDVEDDNLASGTYKIRNVRYENYVQVLSKYYAKPNAETEDDATEIHITYSGKLDDGSYKVTNMSAVAKNGEQADILSYVDKAIMLGKVAIAEVLKGKSSDENIKKAQDYMEDFVRANAYMRVKPVTGTNYVYAIADIPEIPYDVYHEMYRHGVITADTKEAAWDYGVEYVLHYLDTHGTNSTLAQLIRNNITHIEQGHTYYLSEDADGTFGYKDASQFSSTDKTIQWGIDLEEEDQPVESDFYKIHNVGNDLYVKVEGRYYARPAYSEEEATPIAVTIDGQLEDGSMKVTNLVGDGHDIQKYVAHAIELGTALIHQLLDDISQPENVERAIEEMTNFVNENAYMRVKLVPGETDAYYAYVVLPTVPQYIVTEWEKKYPNYNGTMRDWAVQKVKEYLASHNTDPKLKSMVLNNIDKLYEGHTYYLRADGDDTFGIGDLTAGDVDLTDQYYWWGFADAIKAEPFEGYYRIKGADGKYVNVTGRFAATPNAELDDAKTAAGTVIYVGTGEVKPNAKNIKALPLEILRSQGVDVGNKSEAGYMNMINDVMATVAAAVAQIATEKIAEHPTYGQYASLIEPMVMTLVESVDLDLYVEPTITSDGKNAYMLEVNIPDLKEYCDLANDVLGLMGKQGHDLVDNLEAMKKGDGGIMDKLIDAAIEMADMLDGENPADNIWAMLKRKGNTFLSDPYYYNKLLQMNIPEQALIFIKNAVNNPDFNYGTTYCLRQDTDGTFGYASRESLIDNDAAKWILEPFDEQDPNYDAEAYIPFYMKADMAQATVTQSEDHSTTGNVEAGDTYYYTTGYFDFDAKIESDDAEVFTVTSTERVAHKNNATNENAPNYGKTFVYYLANLKQVTGDVIPAMTPFIIRATTNDELNIVLRPVNKPEHPAIESKELLEIKNTLVEALIGKIEGATTTNAPRVISEATSDNKLIGSFFDEEVPEDQVNNYLELTSKTKVEDSSNNILNMSGLGMWKNDVTEIKGNNAYLKGYDEKSDTRLTDFDYGTSFENGKDGDAPGYIFRFEDGTMTAVQDVVTTKTIKSVRYYNVAGIESTQPFEGVSIVVTTYSDGSSSAIKVIK